MAKKGVNVRLSDRQLRGISKLIAEDASELLSDRSKVVSLAVDEFLKRRPEVRIMEEATGYGKKGRKRKK